MKRLKILWLLLMLITILSCKTVETTLVIKPEIMPPPVRTISRPREEGENLNHYMLYRASYYSDLVKQWENWGILVYESVDLSLPESLESVKKAQEKNNE